MATYLAVTAGQKDTDSPITVGLIEKLDQNPIAIAEGASGAPKIQNAAIADGAVHAAQIAADAVGQSEITAGAVHQGELNTSTSEVSTDTSDSGFAGDTDTQVTLPGGAYGFYPQFKSESSSAKPVCQLYNMTSSPNTSYITKAMLFNNTVATYLVSAQQRYINSSPPFDLGDGAVPLFVFLNYNTLTKNIRGYYIADVPPWAYNGPTNITPTRVTKGGKKFKNVATIDEENGNYSYEEINVDMNLKNSDMRIIPHPFAADPNYEVILLDPVETLYLKELHEQGESISMLIKKHYLRLDNETINRATPPGVIASRFKWKNTQSRAGEYVADKRLKRGPFAVVPTA